MKTRQTLSFLLTASISFNAISQDLMNGGFEDYQRFWNMWGAELNDDAYTGLSCLYIENSQPEWKGADQVVAIPVGTADIQLQGFVRLDDVDLGAEPYEMARLAIELQDEDGQAVGAPLEPACEEFGSIKWLKYKRKYPMQPSATQVKISAALANTTGKAWFDDIEIIFTDAFGKMITSEQSAYTILANGDFEQGGEGWSFFGGRISKGGRNDGLCMKISQASPNWIFANQEIELPKGAEYIEVSGFAKGDVHPGANAWEIGRITADFVNTYGNKVGGDQKPAVEVSGEQDWKPFKKKYRVAYGATSVRIECALGNATGSVLFDDLRVRVVAPDEKPIFPYQQFPLVNGDIESNEGWSLWGAKIDDGGRTGKCLHASSEEPIWLGATQIIGIPRGVEKVIAKGWIKTDNLIPGSDHYMKGRISMEFQDHNEQMTGGYQDVVGDMTGTENWKEFTREYKIPDGAYFIKMDCALGNSTGHVYFDDLQLEFIKSDGAESAEVDNSTNYESPLSNGGFEKGAAGWAALGNKVATNIAKTGINAMQVGTDGAEEPRVFQDMMLPKDVAVVEFAGSIHTPKGQEAVSGTVSIIYFTSTRDIITNNEIKINSVTAGQWRDLIAGEPVPEGAEIVRIEATNDGNTPLFIDDFSIVFKNDKGQLVAKSRDVVKFN